MYKPLKIVNHEVHGGQWAMRAMRLPKQSVGDTGWLGVGPRDIDLASRLVRAGDDHAKAMRGIIVWMELECQVGWLIELETYRHGPELAEQKQADLPEKVYTRILTIGYQALKNIYRAKRNHI